MRRFMLRATNIVILAVFSAFLLDFAIMSTPSDKYSENSVYENVSENSDNQQNSSATSSSNQTNSQNKVDSSDFLNSLPQKNDLISGGNYVLSDAVYNIANCVISICQPADRNFFPENAKYNVEFILEDGSSVYQPYFTIWPRMGYIILADGVQRKILDSDGNEIKVADDHFLVFISERDSLGNPVFLDSNTGEYVILSPDGSLTASDYDEIRDDRGIDFDYPSYYGISDDDTCLVNYNGRAFGYTLTGPYAYNVPASYDKAFAFSEGFGCAYDSQNRLYFYNTDGRLRIGGLAVIMYGCGDDRGERSLGYYYFDEGLTRVTKRTYSRGELVSEYKTFIDREGNEFKTPADYNVYSYSDGMILLEKNGLYGYMTSRGKWIGKPNYVYARPFFEGLAVVGMSDGKKGMIDKDGNYVIPPVFDEITDCSGGVIAVYDSDTGWNILNKLQVQTTA